MNNPLRILAFLVFSLSINSRLDAQKIPIEQYKVGDIVDDKYAPFGIGNYSKEDEEAYSVKFIENINEYTIISFLRSLPCSPVICPEDFQFFLLKEGLILNKLELSFQREGSPRIEVLHDTFIQYLETSHDWYENEDGIMVYDESGDSYGGIRLAIIDDKLRQLSDLSKQELRILRNLIFAKYGYVFKSKDLNDYFRNTKWYKANPGLEINKKLSMQDKELIDHIQKLESILNKQ